MIEFKNAPSRFETSFKADQVFMVLDFETFSEADITKVGGYEYAVHPSTEVLCAAWSIGTLETLKTKRAKSWHPDQEQSDFGEFVQGILDPNVILVAHNAFFDRLILKHVFATKDMYSKCAEIQAIPIERWLCTQALALARALPRSLEKAVDALKLSMRKNKDGKRLIRKFSILQKPPKSKRKVDLSSFRKRNDHSTDPIDFERFVEYCRDDVDATVGLLSALDMLHVNERKVWCLDQKVNEYGFRLDRSLIFKILKMLEIESNRLDSAVQELSFGMFESARQPAEVKQFLAMEGVHLKSITKEAVTAALSDPTVQGDARRMLELRAAVSQSSTAKYKAFELASRSDGRIRGALQYHAATTGRFGGVGANPQNLPRGTIKDSALAAEVLEDCDLETIRLLYREPMDVFSSCLRNMIIASEGHTFDVGDYAQIEARVLFWLAGDTKALDAFRGGRDLYKEQASEVFGKPVDAIDPFERFIGKSLILGCGFQMGAPKFAESVSKHGHQISLELATKAVSAYRTSHKQVCELWRKLEKAAIAAVQNPGQVWSICKTSWFVKNNVLYCELPSGRRLAYQSPEVVFKATQWDAQKPTIQFWGTDSKTKKWCKQNTYGGKLTENVVQAIARDIMVSAMLRIDQSKKWNLILSVHDELIAERRLDADASHEEFRSLMESVPNWAKGIPVATDGWFGTRYMKA